MSEAIVEKIILLLIGGFIFSIIAVVLLCNKKKLPIDILISLLALCILGAIGFFFVAICIGGALVAAQ